jgi:hypothetical protein
MCSIIIIIINNSLARKAKSSTLPRFYIRQLTSEVNAKLRVFSQLIKGSAYLEGKG